MLCSFDGKFNRTYGHYPKYPVADAGYGSYNNYLIVKNTAWKIHEIYHVQKETTDKSIMRIRIVL